MQLATRRRSNSAAAGRWNSMANEIKQNPRHLIIFIVLLVCCIRLWPSDPSPRASLHHPSKVPLPPASSPPSAVVPEESQQILLATEDSAIQREGDSTQRAVDATPVRTPEEESPVVVVAEEQPPVSVQQSEPQSSSAVLTPADATANKENQAEDTADSIVQSTSSSSPVPPARSSLSHLDVFLSSISLPPPGRGTGSKGHARVAVRNTNNLAQIVQDVLHGSSVPVRVHVLVDHATWECNFAREREETVEAARADAQSQAKANRATDAETLAAGTNAAEEIRQSAKWTMPSIPEMSHLRSRDQELLREAFQTPHRKFCQAMAEFGKAFKQCRKTQGEDLNTPVTLANGSPRPNGCAPVTMYVYDYQRLYATNNVLSGLCQVFGHDALNPACLYLSKTVLLDLMPDWVEELLVLDTDMRLDGDLLDLYSEIEAQEPRFRQVREELAEAARATSEQGNTAIQPLRTPDYAMNLPIIGLVVEQQLSHAAVGAFDPSTEGWKEPFGILQAQRGFNGGVQLQHLALMRSTRSDDGSKAPGESYRDALRNFHFRMRSLLELGDQTVYSQLNFTRPEFFHELNPRWNRQLCALYWPNLLEYTAGRAQMQARRTWTLNPVKLSECEEAFAPPGAKIGERIRIIHANCASVRNSVDATARNNEQNHQLKRALEADPEDHHNKDILFDEQSLWKSQLDAAAYLRSEDPTSCHWKYELVGSAAEWQERLHRCMPVRMREALRGDQAWLEYHKRSSGGYE